MNIFFLAGFLAQASGVPPGQAFRAYEDQYFYLYSQTDKEGFSCSMELNTISQLVRGLKAKVDDGSLPMEIKDSLPSFGVKYVRMTDSLEFNRPSLSLSIKDGTPIEHPEAIRAAMNQIFTSFNQQLEGSIGLTQGLLHEFLISRHDVIREVQFEATDVGYQASFAMDGGRTTTRFDGQQKHSEIQLGSTTIQAKASFEERTGGKLFLTGAEIEQAGGVIRMTVATQTVEGMVLPALIEVSSGPVDAIEGSGGLKVRFVDCKVK